MKTGVARIGLLLLLPMATVAGGLSVISFHPQNALVSPGSNATFMVTASDATSYQWRFDGSDISGATNSTLVLTNVQLANAGYYLVIAKNSAGWVPSQMAYLSVAAYPGGLVPFSNRSNTNYFGWQARNQLPSVAGYSDEPITNGYAQVVAGPELDQMQPIGNPYQFEAGDDGYFDAPNQFVPTVAPGQTVYYRVVLRYPVYGDGEFSQPSTTLELVAGGGTFPVPSSGGLMFPIYIGWPDPNLDYSPPTNQVRVPGENFDLTISYGEYYYAPGSKWRKDGRVLTYATNLISSGFDPTGRVTAQHILTITNVQPSDAGIYDAIVPGGSSLITPKISLSVALNGTGTFQSPRFDGTNFISDFVGAEGRRYAIEWSTNLSSWADLLTVTNNTGTITISNLMTFPGGCFYRTRLLPL